MRSESQMDPEVLENECEAVPKKYQYVLLGVCSDEIRAAADARLR